MLLFGTNNERKFRCLVYTQGFFDNMYVNADNIRWWCLACDEYYKWTKPVQRDHENEERLARSRVLKSVHQNHEQSYQKVKAVQY